jgi:thiol-disulfide isomerase/thioredoxin
MNNAAVAGLVIIIAAAAGYIVQQQYIVSQEISEASQVAVSDRIDFELTHLDGSKRRLSDWDGEARLINFWATWCAPCRREIPLLKKLQAAKPEKQIQVIGVAVDFMDEVRSYAEEADFNYPILVGEADAMAAAELSGMDFIGLPFTMIIAGDGTLMGTHVGELMQPHIDRIVEIMQDVENGTLDLETAQRDLRNL